ncbi:MAG: Maf family nucleotide pyrophosphatase [Bacteroidia bacterium]|jgi:septum formation protein
MHSLPETFPPLILASRSPRRRKLLSEIGFNLEIADIDVDESFPEHLKGGEVAAYLAGKKALAYGVMPEDKVLVCADTIVVLGEEVINKPTDAADAARMLSALSGHTHRVFTGVCLRRGDEILVFTESTEVEFRAIRPDEIDYYISEYQPFDKAGSYGIQDWLGYTCVTAVRGCFYNVMGFPMARFYRELQAFCKGKH